MIHIPYYDYDLYYVETFMLALRLTSLIKDKRFGWCVHAGVVDGLAYSHQVLYFFNLTRFDKNDWEFFEYVYSLLTYTVEMFIHSSNDMGNDPDIGGPLIGLFKLKNRVKRIGSEDNAWSKKNRQTCMHH
jgi:hypothetical protein